MLSNGGRVGKGPDGQGGVKQNPLIFPACNKVQDRFKCKGLTFEVKF